MHAQSVKCSSEHSKDCTVTHTELEQQCHCTDMCQSFCKTVNQYFWTEVTLNFLFIFQVRAMCGVDSGYATQWDGSCSERQENENVNDFWAFPFNSLYRQEDRYICLCLYHCLFFTPAGKERQYWGGFLRRLQEVGSYLPDGHMKL